MSDTSKNDSVLEWLGRDPRVLFVLTVLYIVVGIICVATDYTLNDEGLVTFTTADLARHHPLEVFFVQKAKPVLVLLYRPVAGLGVHGLLYVHLLAMAPAIAMIGAVARALGFALPNIPALALAASPAFLLAAPAGLSNADGVTGVVLVLYLLLARKNAFAAGLVLGCLPWVRHELALFAAIMFVRGAFAQRDLKFIAGAMTFPVIYGLAGGLYHHDLIWLINYPPSMLFSMPGTPVWADFSYRVLLRGLLGLSPLIAFSLCAPWSRYTSIERWLLAYAGIWIFIASILPAWHIANFGFVPRYMMVLTPVAALAGCRAIDAYYAGDARHAVAGSAAALVAVLAYAAGMDDMPANLPIVTALIVAVALGLLNRGAVAATLLTVLLAAGPALGIHTEIPRQELAPYMSRLAEWLRSHPDETEVAVYTNVPLLAPYLDGAAGLPGLDIRFLIGLEHAYDMENMMSTESGQRGKLVAMMEAAKFNGARGILPEQLSPELVPDGSLFVFRHDSRLAQLMLPEVWDAYLEEIYNDDFVVSRFHATPAAAQR